MPYTFGGRYIRYGAPEVLDTTVDPAHPRVLVRYRHWNGSAVGGDAGRAARRHPGRPRLLLRRADRQLPDERLRALRRQPEPSNPTRTTYRWLVAANPSDASTPFSVVPQTVNLPVPVWNVTPIPVAAGGGVNVRAEVEPVEEENHAQCGEPQWMKVFKIESELDLQPEDLNKLLLGVAGGIVPDETEVETEWKLIQSKPGDAEDDDEDADVKEDPLDDGKHSVIRRYEFYTLHRTARPGEQRGAALHRTTTRRCRPTRRSRAARDLGDFVGAQNVAVDVDLATIDDRAADGRGRRRRIRTRALVVGGLPPYTVSVTDGAVPDGLQLDPATGVLSGTPTQAGAFSFSVQASDAAGGLVTGTFDVTVTTDLCPDDPDKTDPGACGCGVADGDVNGNGIVDCQETTLADLAAVVAGPKAAPRAGKRLRIVLRAVNHGPAVVPGATIAASITGGPFSALKLPRACSGTADAIVCSTGRVGTGKHPGSKTRALSVIPAAGAQITVDASVSSPVFDPNPANQAASLSVTVP